MPEATASRVELFLAEIKATAFLQPSSTLESFAYMTDYFRRKAGKHRLWFRITSTLLMTLSAVLPVLASFGDKIFGDNKDLLVGVLSAAIALLTGLLTHFRWEIGWRGQTEALFALQALKAEWEVEVVAAKMGSDDADAVAALQKAYKHFCQRTFEVVHSEMGEYFKVQQAPPAEPNR